MEWLQDRSALGALGGWHYWQTQLHRVVNSTVYKRVYMGVVLLNSIYIFVLASYDMDSHVQTNSHVVELTFFVLFVLDMAVKLAGLGPRSARLYTIATLAYRLHIGSTGPIPGTSSMLRLPRAAFLGWCCKP